PRPPVMARPDSRLDTPGLPSSRSRRRGRRAGRHLETPAVRLPLATQPAATLSTASEPPEELREREVPVIGLDRRGHPLDDGQLENTTVAILRTGGRTWLPRGRCNRGAIGLDWPRMTEGAAAITLESVTKRFGGHDAVQDVS